MNKKEQRVKLRTNKKRSRKSSLAHFFYYKLLSTRIKNQVQIWPCTRCLSRYIS